MFALNRICRNFKFKGKGHEHEDLQELLKVLEHWAHRLYPKLPFKDTLEQIEKLGTKKNVQVLGDDVCLYLLQPQGSEYTISRKPVVKTRLNFAVRSDSLERLDR